MSNELVCYTAGNDFVTSSNQYFPCAGGNSTSNSSNSSAQTCCYAGDFCMEDGICHYTHTVPNGSGYYMAGCTDPTWNDPACPKPCLSEYGADVVYNSTTQQWNCCVSSPGSLNCDQPSEFTLQAPSPDNLAIVKQLNTPVPSPASTMGIGRIVLSTSTSNSSSSTTSTSSATTTSSSEDAVQSFLSGNHTITALVAGSSSRSSVQSVDMVRTTGSATMPVTSSSATASLAATSSSSEGFRKDRTRLGLAIFALLPMALVAFSS